MESPTRRRMPRLRVAAAVAAIVIALFGLIGYFAIPKVARWGIETVAARELGRAIRVQEISANPFILRVTLRGLVVEGTAGDATPLLAVQELIANASSVSLIRRAPVLDAVVVDGLTANIVRLDEQRFNFSDIVERIRAKPKTDEPTWFSISNIEVANGLINFDDRPTGKKHTLSDIRIGIPFLSSLPVDVEVKVEPAFAARINGAPIEARGATQPFQDTLESSLNIRLDQVDIPTYVAYSPVPLNFTVPSGRLSTDLRVAFRRAAPAQQAQLLVSGAVEVTAFELAAPAKASKRLIRWQSLKVVLDEVEPLARRIVVGDLSLQGPEIEAVRDADGTVNWARLAEAPLQQTDAPGPAVVPAAAAPIAFTLKHAALSAGRMNVVDESVGRFELQIGNLNGEFSGLSSASKSPGKVRIGAEISDGGGAVTADGEVTLAPVAGQIAISGRDVKMRTAARYLASVVNADVDGNSDADGVLDFALEPEVQAVLRDIRWNGKAIKVRGPAGSGADFDIDAIRMEGSQIDLVHRSISISTLALDTPRTTIRRLADGRLNWMTALRAPARAVAENNSVAPPPWNVSLKELTLTRGDVRIEDLAVTPAVRLRASGISGAVRNLAGDGKTPADLELAARFSTGGTVTLKGNTGWNPIASDIQVDARNVEISALRPYLATRLNAVLARAELSARGRVGAMQGAADGPVSLTYKGSTRIGNLHLLDSAGENDLLKWQLLELQQVALEVGKDTPQIGFGKIALSDFYARVIVSDQGRLNLVDLVRREGEPDKPTEATPQPTGPAQPTPRSEPQPQSAGGAPTPDAVAAPAAAEAQQGPRPVIRIGEIELVRGNVNFTDNFIKPNYTANMTGLNGSVTTLASDSAEPATMKIVGTIDDIAPLDISGRLNPLAPRLFLDIEGRTKGVDLPRLTPYSMKYAGYPILKGKLSMEVKYKIDDGKLAANNHLFIDQLTFGEKVDSPTATKLPVQLAVSLLKNSRGEIDLNLPISGTLDDPKFSVGAVIVQVIVNLLTRVVTAPFTLLAAAFGGGEELGIVEFAPGSFALAPEQLKRVDTLSKALNDRPGLKLDIIGRVDPARDTDGVKEAKLDNKLRALKVRQTVRASGAAVDPASVSISAEERPKLVAEVYSNEDIPNKPRNAIGFAKSIPAAEMEPLILANLAVTPDDLRALANQRAAAVRNRLETEGQVSRERLFLVEPKLTADGIKDKGATTRVDFALK